MVDIKATIQKKAPLEDIMAAMDVVDTLRHQRGIAERELDSQGRRARLLQRLKEMYQAQGIEVSDQILKEGIIALEEERFKYQPVPVSWRTRVSAIWASRMRWGKAVGFLTVVGSLFTSIYLVTDVLPERALRKNLPQSISATLNDIENTAHDSEVIERAQFQANNANTALANGDLERAQKILSDLTSLQSKLKVSYSIRVISRAGEDSGVWRIPDVNAASRNYYLIVEAVNSENEALELDILNEETNKSSLVKTWGIRVNEQTFFKIAADKKDDGIIQGNRIGEKPVGYVNPRFTIPTTGGAITDWGRGGGK